ncbi:MAG: rhodanese-like domain-containing protein [Alphaproteobacteria bacterium]|nr:rhodanese-like domain-containing protein [Alphaproteobacteria bacterium]
MITKGYKELVSEAEAEVETLTVAEARQLLSDPRVQFVDVRDVRELAREGIIPGAFHCPRGMLEFWVDPESPYYRDVFGSGKKFVFFCAAGWRSALATQSVQRMGLNPVAHIGGGFTTWKESGAPIELKEAKK